MLALDPAHDVALGTGNLLAVIQMHFGRIYLHLLSDERLINCRVWLALMTSLGDHGVALRELLDVLRVV